MSATLSDEDLVRSLRGRADVAMPAMSLDPASAISAGHLYRRRRSATAVVAAVGVTVLAAGAVLGGQALLAPRPQPLASLGDARVVELPAGLMATSELGRQVDADGRSWWDTGLVFDLDVLDRDQVAANPTNPSADTGIGLVVRDNGVAADAPTFGRTSLVWRSDDHAADYAGKTYPSTLDTTYRFNDMDNPTVLSGAVPRGIVDPRVVIYFPSGLVRYDALEYIEVPTFRAPTQDGRLLYALQIAPFSSTTDGVVGPVDEEGAWVQGVAFPVIVGADGTPFLNAGCSGTLTECYAEQPDGGTALRAAIESIGGRTDG